jgi:hypothetical protein
MATNWRRDFSEREIKAITRIRSINLRWLVAVMVPPVLLFIWSIWRNFCAAAAYAGDSWRQGFMRAVRVWWHGFESGVSYSGYRAAAAGEISEGVLGLHLLIFLIALFFVLPRGASLLKRCWNAIEEAPDDACLQESTIRESFAQWEWHLLSNARAYRRSVLLATLGLVVLLITLAAVFLWTAFTVAMNHGLESLSSILAVAFNEIDAVRSYFGYGLVVRQHMSRAVQFITIAGEVTGVFLVVRLHLNYLERGVNSVLSSSTDNCPTRPNAE